MYVDTSTSDDGTFDDAAETAREICGTFQEEIDAYQRLLNETPSWDRQNLKLTKKLLRTAEIRYDGFC